MATIHFCAATGAMFRGNKNEINAHACCEEQEKPKVGNCLHCPMRVTGYRERNSQPYRVNGIAVTGPGVTKEKRQWFGEQLRQARSSGRGGKD